MDYDDIQHCVACGGSFQTLEIENHGAVREDPLVLVETTYDSRLLPDESTKWIYNSRIIGQRNKDCFYLGESCYDGSFISAPAEWGQRSSQAIVPHFMGRGTRHAVSLFEVLSYQGVKMAFPIHDHCLSLTKRLLNFRSIFSTHAKSDLVPHNLFSLCAAMQRHRERNLESEKRKVNQYYGGNGLEWNHDYYGARQFWEDGWQCRPGWEWLCADPMNFPTLSTYILSRIPPKDGSAQPPQSTLPAINPNGLVLPAEIMSMILSHLSLPIVLTLRSTCQSLQEQVSNLMTERFWQERVLSGISLPWLFDGELAEHEVRGLYGDWERGLRSLSLLASKVEVKPNVILDEDSWLGAGDDLAPPLGLRNRWRIWKILKDIGLDGEELTSETETYP